MENREEGIYFCLDYDSFIDKLPNTDRVWRTDGKYEPFVYIIREISTNLRYIGVKYSKKCLESWLGTKYFTSSNYILWNDKEFDIVKIYPCASNHDAIILEYILIDKHDAVYSNKYYNKHHPSIGFCPSTPWNKGISPSQETRQKISKSNKGKSKKQSPSRKYKGKDNPFYGKTHTEEFKKAISERNSGENNRWYGTNGPMGGKSHKEETKAKMSKARKGKKRYANPYIFSVIYCYPEEKENLPDSNDWYDWVPAYGFRDKEMRKKYPKLLFYS